jgi:hypothetical protein
MLLLSCTAKKAFLSSNIVKNANIMDTT